jgi:hypothetical protein
MKSSKPSGEKTRELQAAIGAQKWQDLSNTRMREKATKIHDENKRKAKKLQQAQILIRDIFGNGDDLVGAKHVSRDQRGHREIADALKLTGIRFKVEKQHPTGSLKIILQYSLLCKGLGGMRREFQTPEKREAFSKFREQLVKRNLQTKNSIQTLKNGGTNQENTGTNPT